MNNKYGLFMFSHISGKWLFQVPRNPKKYGKSVKTFISNSFDNEEYYNYAQYDFKDLVHEFLKLCGLKTTTSGKLYEHWQSNIVNNDIVLIERGTNKAFIYKDDKRDFITEQAIYEYFNEPYYGVAQNTEVPTYNTKVIALCGDIGAGKDTTAKYLKELYQDSFNYKVKVIAFADRVKDIVATAHPEFIDRQKLQGITETDRFWRTQEIPELSKQYNTVITPRKLMQIYGDLYRNHINPDFWINSVKNQILQAKKEKVDYVIITDCRFVNELKFVLNELHAYLIEVKRDGGSPWIQEYLETGIKPQDKHESDVDWIKFVNNLTEQDRKFTFNNITDNMLELQDQIAEFAEKIM